MTDEEIQRQIDNAKKEWDELKEKYQGFSQKTTKQGKKVALARKRYMYWCNRNDRTLAKKAKREKDRLENTDVYEKEKRRWRENSRKAREENKEKVNEYQRENYHKNRAENARKQKERKHKRNPWIGIERATLQLKRGDKSLSEYSEFIHECIRQTNQRNGKGSNS